ncbi:MAG: hypothetical protein ACWA41_10300 [Putridiphycobacter sp.]
MFSKKEEFTNSIQFRIGIRHDDLTTNSYTTINDLCDFFIQKNNESNWKTLPFLNLFFETEQYLKEELNQDVNFDFNLNDKLDGNQKKAFLDFIESKNIKPIEQSRTNGLNNIIAWFPVFGILGPMLISTYLVTAKDITGWIYLSGLAGLMIWLALIKTTQLSRKRFNPEHLLDYIKSTYTIRYKTLSQNEVNPELVKQFISKELSAIYGKTFDYSEEIPTN